MFREGEFIKIPVKGLSPYIGDLADELKSLRVNNHPRVEESLPGLAGLSFGNALKKVHQLIFQGAELEERWRVGDWRVNNVACGEYHPPRASDVRRLIGKGEGLFGDLEGESAFSNDPACASRVASMKCLYALMVHPFFDGNGETAKKLWSLTRISSGSEKVKLPSSKEYKGPLNTLLRENGLMKFSDMIFEITVDVEDDEAEITKDRLQAKEFIENITDHPQVVSEFAKHGQDFLNETRDVNSRRDDLDLFFQASLIITEVFDRVAR